MIWDVIALIMTSQNVLKTQYQTTTLGQAVQHAGMSFDNHWHKTLVDITFMHHIEPHLDDILLAKDDFVC